MLDVVLRRRGLAILGALWVVLLIPSVPLWGHECHGFVGFLAHSPLYAFQALTAVLAVMALLASARAAVTRS